MGINKTDTQSRLRTIGEIAGRLDDIEQTLDECQDSTKEKLEEVRTVLESATEAIDEAVARMTGPPAVPSTDTGR